MIDNKATFQQISNEMDVSNYTGNCMCILLKYFGYKWEFLPWQEIRIVQ